MQIRRRDSGGAARPPCCRSRAAQPADSGPLWRHRRAHRGGGACHRRTRRPRKPGGRAVSPAPVTEPRAFPIQWRLAGAFALAFAISVLVVVLSYPCDRPVHRVEPRRRRGRARDARAQRLISMVQDAETGQRGFLLPGEARYLDPYHVRSSVWRSSEPAWLRPRSGHRRFGGGAPYQPAGRAKQLELENRSRPTAPAARPPTVMVRSGRGPGAHGLDPRRGAALERNWTHATSAGAGPEPDPGAGRAGNDHAAERADRPPARRRFSRAPAARDRAGRCGRRAQRGTGAARSAYRGADGGAQRTDDAHAVGAGAGGTGRTDARVSEQQAALALEQARVSMGALAGSEARFRELADAMPQVVWTARADGYLDYFNQRWYEFTGAQPGRGGDASWLPYLHPDDVRRLPRAVVVPGGPDGDALRDRVPLS